MSFGRLEEVKAANTDRKAEAQADWENFSELGDTDGIESGEYASESDGFGALSDQNKKQQIVSQKPAVEDDDDSDDPFAGFSNQNLKKVTKVEPVKEIKPTNELKTVNAKKDHKKESEYGLYYDEEEDDESDDPFAAFSSNKQAKTLPAKKPMSKMELFQKGSAD